MSNIQTDVQEQKQMELDKKKTPKTPGSKYTTPQNIPYLLESFKNDLKHLSATGVPSNILTALQNRNITTYDEILLLRPKDIPEITQENLFSIQKSVSYSYNVTIRNIYCMIKDQNVNQRKTYYSTGIINLDKLINTKHPGISTKEITSFIGTSSSGKTLLLYQIALNCLMDNNNNNKCIIYIDCQNQFDSQRIYDMLKHIYKQKKSLNNNNNINKDLYFENIMKRIQVYSVFNFQMLFDLITNNNDFETNIRTNALMLLIDNIGLNTYEHELNTTFMGFSEINKMGRTLKYLATTYNISIITTSLTICKMITNNANKNKNKNNNKNVGSLSEYWVNSTRASIYKNWYNYIDNEIHLLLTGKYGYIQPLLTKSHSNKTYETSLDNVCVLIIRHFITG